MNYELLNNITSVFLIAFVVTKFEPLHWLLETFKHFIFKNINYKMVFDIITLPFYCLKCFAFWYSLIYYKDLNFAALMFFICYMYLKFIDSKLEKITLQ